MENGIAIMLAWPETKCKQAGAWYDSIMRFANVNKNGYYKVGHAAIVLVDANSGKCHYFDFGRYQTPKGKGRVRDASTDFELKINTNAEFDLSGNLLNLEEIVQELQWNESCNGDGELKVGQTPINFNNAFEKAKTLQRNIFIKYGPFVLNGTNCSRFVRTIALKGMRPSVEKLLIAIPPMITPTPIWNVKAVNEHNPTLEPTQVIFEEYEAKTA